MDEGGAGAVATGALFTVGAAAGLSMDLALLISKRGCGFPMGLAELMSKSGFG